MDKKYISRFIHFHATEAVIDRGEALYRSGKTELIEIDETRDYASFNVKGGRLYQVNIKNFLIKDISASCNCPYDWNTICKHTVASLLHLSDLIIEKKSNLTPPQNLRATTNVPIEIPMWKDLNHQTLGIKIYNSPARFYTKKKLPEIIEFSEKNLVFSIISDYYYPENRELVNFRFLDGRVFCTSNSMEINLKRFSRIEEYCLLSLIENNQSKVFNYFFNGEFLNEKEDILSLFDLPDSILFNDYFKVSFHENKILYFTHKKGNGLISPSGNPDIPKTIKTLGKAFHQTPKESKILRQIGFSISIGSKYTSINEFKIKTIKGQANKANTELISHIDYYDNLKYNEICYLSDQQKKIFALIEGLNENGYAYTKNKLNPYEDEIEEELVSDPFHPQIQNYLISLQQLFELLSKEKYVYFNTYSNDYKIKKSHLIRSEIVSEPLEMIIDVSKNNNWLSLKPVFKIDGKLIDIEKRNMEASCYYTTLISNKVFVYNSLNTCAYLDNFEYPLQTSEKNFDFLFDQIIHPLAQQFSINISKDIIKKTEHFPDADQRQIYISEENELLRFDPVVVYTDGKSHYLFNRGNHLERKNGELLESKRNDDFENSFLEYLSTLHPDFEQQKHNRYFHLSFNEVMHQMWFYGFYEKLHKENVQVFGINELKKFKYSPFKAKVNTSISSGVDWFEIDIQVSFGNYQIKISDLKKAIINKQQFIQLKNGTVGILPEKWLEKFKNYFRNAEINNEKLQISKLRFSIIDELYENIDNEQILKEIADKKERFNNINQIEDVKVPKGIKAKLRPYQIEGLQWLHFLDSMGWGGILADDMGLGKTLQILGFLKGRLKKSDNPAIIIVPTTLLFNWENEIKKFAPTLKAFYHYGLNREKNTDRFKKYHLVFTSYGVLVRDIEILKDYEFSYAILDESQAIKNPVSQRYKAVQLIKANNKFAITGTPIENSTFDLFAQMNFVNPGFFGDIKSFKENYSNKIDKDGNVEITTELQKISKPFILRRTKEKVASELPAKTEDIIYCEMEDEQRKVYEAYRNEYRDKILKKIEEEGIGKSKLYVLEGLLRLRQICDSPALLKDKTLSTKQSVKIKELIGYITQKTAKHKLLIFSQFVGMLHLIKEELHKLHIDFEYLDGKSSKKERENSVNNFQVNNSIRVFLVSLKAGGTGLNLTSADYVFLVDPWWNPAVEEQAIDRTHRIGQDKNVFAYRMICKNTIEEKVIKLQTKKKKIAEDIIQTDESTLKSMKLEDIRDLFS